MTTERFKFWFHERKNVNGQFDNALYNEWFYDENSKELYYVPEATVNPNDLDMKIKTKAYTAFESNHDQFFMLNLDLRKTLTFQRITYAHMSQQ